jgi:transcriptional regulator with XRE-family HTH domain/tetratricopeptide (TPR) repeat protein
MPPSARAIQVEQFVTFGDLLRFLRRRAGLTQAELAAAVGYSGPQISRLEHNQRVPDSVALTARFVASLDIEHEPALMARLLELATTARQGPLVPRRDPAPSGSPEPPHLLKPTLLDRIVQDQLVGREAELAAAAVVWQKALTGAAQVLLVCGEPGVGKTHFAREVTALAQTSGAAALAGECYPDGAAPYAPIAQILRQMIDGTPTADLDLPQFLLADLITLVPGLRPRFPNVLPNPPLDPQSEQERIYDSVVESITRLASRVPLILFVDDAHWADAGTLHLLRHLARRSRSTLNRGGPRLMVIVTYREDELEEGGVLREMLLEVSRLGVAARVTLARLSRDQTRELLGLMFAEAITPEFLEAVYHETEGNPFFVKEVCKALIESGKLTFADGRWHRPGMAEVEIPHSIRMVIQARVGKLPAEAQRVLQLGALLGREFELDILRGASRLDEDTLITALESAERAQIIAELRGSRALTFAFAHALIPATLRENLSAIRRQQLHLRAAMTFETLRPDDLEALAYHFAAAGDHAKAVEYSRRAAGRAEGVYAYDQAIRHLRIALTLLDAGAPAETRRAVLEQLADLHSRLREGVQAIPLYQEALNLWGTTAASADTPRVSGIRLHRKLVEAIARLNRFEDYQRFKGVAQASLEAGLELAASEPPHPEAVRLLRRACPDEWSFHRILVAWDTAERYARAAVEMAEQLDSPGDLSAALDSLSAIYSVRGLLREAVHIALRRLALSREPRFSDDRERVSILNSAGLRLTYVGEYAQAMPLLEEAEQLASQIYDADLQVAALRGQSLCCYQLDQWDHLLAIEAKWRELKKQHPKFVERVGVMCFQIALTASVYARRGQFEQAATLREEALSIMVANSGPPSDWARGNHY